MHHSTDARVQRLPLRECHSEWHRDHAYDRQRADETHWQNQAFCSLPVLLVGNVSYPHHIAFVRLNRLTATEPTMAMAQRAMKRHVHFICYPDKLPLTIA